MSEIEFNNYQEETAKILLEINKGISYPFYLLMGNEPYFIDIIVESLKKKNISNQSKDFDFTFNVGYAQDFDLKIDKKLKIENQKIKIDEGVMKETLANLQQQFGEITNADAISQGDTIYGVLSAKNKLEDKEVTFELKELHKNVSKKLIGLKVGASMDLDHKKSFNDERYFTHITKLTEEEIKSVKGKFTFTIKGISHTLPAPVNQELFDKTFGKDNVKTEEEFYSKNS